MSSAGAFAPDPFAGVGVEELAESWMEMHDTDGDGKLSLHELQASQEAGMGGAGGGEGKGGGGGIGGMGGDGGGAVVEEVVDVGDVLRSALG